MNECTIMELHDMLLYSSRHGDVGMVQELLSAWKDGKIDLDVSCKGKNKSNQGWTPLHLASYFGHKRVIELLLENNADINAVNNAGDTPLHKAAFIGREDLVLLLLQHNADVNIFNGEAQIPRDLAHNEEVKKLLLATEQTEARKNEEKLLAASREGDLETVNHLLKGEKPPNINCVDAQGNTCLHCASYRGHKEIAVLLLQNGIDTSIKNSRGQSALDLARDSQMHQVLSVPPIRQLQKSVARFEGQLLKRSRFLGWKPLYVVLERGVMTYFNTRADATTGVKRKDFKYLDDARIVPLECDDSTFIIHFSDSTVHRLSVLNCGETGQISRQKWINAFQDHIAFSTHYLNQGNVSCDSDEDENDLKPLGTMQDALQTSAAHHQIMQQQLSDTIAVIKALKNNGIEEGMVGSIMKRFNQLSDTSGNMVKSLGHCLTLFQQQEEVRMLQLKQEQEKCRVLEEALHVLAKEHHELEQSMVSHLSSPLVSPNQARSPRYYDTSDDEFYDAFDADSDSDTLVTAASIASDSDTLVSFPASNLTRSPSTCSRISSCRCAGKRHHPRRPQRRQQGSVPRTSTTFCRNS